MVEVLADDLLAEAERALEVGLEAGAEHVVAAINAGRTTEISWREGRVETVRESAGHSLSVRLHVDGRYSSHGTNDLRPDSLAAFVADAVELTRALEPDPHRLPVDPALYEGRSDLDLELCDRALTGFDRERALAWLGEMDQEARAHERVLSSTSRIDSSHNRSAMVTSNGFRGARAGTALWCVTEVTVRDEGDKRPEASTYRGARHLDDLPEPRGVAAEARRRALARLGSVKGPSKRATLVVDREAAPRLFARVLGALSAGAIQQKRSFLAERLGQPIAAPCLSLSDEPLLKRGFSSRHFDGEGIAARPRGVIRGGVLETYFVDSYYGHKLGWQPTTGSSSNTVFELGTRDLDELVAATDDGLLVTSWMGGNADPTTGDFSFGIRGHLIEGGRRGAPVTEMNVTGNYLELLKSLVEVGNDPHPCSSLRCPSLVFEGVSFSGGSG